MRLPIDETTRLASPAERWALITATEPVAANAFFEITDQQRNVVNAVGFNAQPETTDLTLPLELETPAAANGNAERTVGVAMANANPTVAQVELKLRAQDGTVLATRQHAVPPNSQWLFSVRDEFQGAAPNGSFVGSIAVHSSIPVAVNAVQSDFGAFSAIPVISGQP